MQGDDDQRGGQQPDDPGRSREREKQDAMLDEAAHEESWLSRLKRSMRERKGRPRAGGPQMPDRRDS
jgi:hypothetical protein